MEGAVPPAVEGDNFTKSHYMDATVYVPQGSLATYQSADVWKNFWDIQEIGAPETPDVEVKKCATPIINFNNNGLDIICDTEGVELVTTVSCNDSNTYYGDRIDFSAIYEITTYATLSGYENSDVATATLCWIENGDGDDVATGVINIPATAALITSTNGTVTISCPLDGETVAVYTTSGVLIGTTTIENGAATIATGLSKGTIAVVKIGEKSLKVII